MTKSKTPNTALRQQMQARLKASRASKTKPDGFLSQDKFPSVQTEHFETPMATQIPSGMATSNSST